MAGGIGRWRAEIGAGRIVICGIAISGIMAGIRCRRARVARIGVEVFLAPFRRLLLSVAGGLSRRWHLRPALILSAVRCRIGGLRLRSRLLILWQPVREVLRGLWLRRIDAGILGRGLV